MTDLKNPIQMGIVDRGNFIFPISSLPKGEGVGKIKFPLFVPDYLLDEWDGTLQNFDDFLCKTWNWTLRKHHEFLFDWWSQEDGDINIKIFKKNVEQSLSSMGVNYWIPEIYSIFCSFVKKRRLDKLKCRDMAYFSSFDPFDPKRWFSDEVLRTRGPVFNRSRTLAKIDRIDGAISKKFMEPIIIDYKMSSLMRSIVSNQKSESHQDEAIANSENLIDSSQIVSNVTDEKFLPMFDDHPECPITREETICATISDSMKEKAEKSVSCQSQVASLYFFYEYEIPKRYLRMFLHLEDFLYDLYEYNITKFLLW